MSKKLVIVESPSKCKTILKLLKDTGDDWTILASYGHCVDFPKKNGAVDVEHDFAPTYEIIERNRGHVEQIIRAVSRSDTLYLASDLDREGEAIAFHVLEILKEKGLLKNKTVHRITFSEITKKAVQDAVANPRELNMDMVHAQQARRTLDYLFGFTLSPVLWRKVHSGLSAGRVQSPALRMIVEREEEIEKFDPKEYWTIEASLHSGAEKHGEFTAKLVQYEGKKFEQFDIVTEERALEAVRRIKKAAPNGTLPVGSVTSRERQRKPYAPFTTSTLQMDAARQLGFPTSKTMRVAQGLYEGIDIGQGERVGLITYMRTDAVNLSEDALHEIRGFIKSNYPADYLPETANRYHSKSKNAQEAHEAIRPSSILREPKQVERYLDKDQLKLYTLIWKRAVACQMTSARLNTVSVEFPIPHCEGGSAAFRATGSTVVFPGFLLIYDEGKDSKKKDDEDERRLPFLEEGKTVELKDVDANQHFTEPPPRYSEAALVKSLEEHDIGRPSTYANIIQTLLNREYVEIKDKRFHPTDIGRSVAHFLANHFTQYVDYEFTANLEGELDAIAKGEKGWLDTMNGFWKPFKKLVDEKNQTVDRDAAQGARVLGTDPESGRPVSARLGRFGPIIQIGTKADTEKPRFASLPEGKSIQSITFEEAMAVFKTAGALPRTVGKGETGEDVIAGKGKFGPYVREGKIHASLPKEHDPVTVTLEQAKIILADKKRFLAERYIRDFGEGLQILKGRFGNYATDGHRNANIPEGKDPKTMCREEVMSLLDSRGKKSRSYRKDKKVLKSNTKDKKNKIARNIDDLPM